MKSKTKMYTTIAVGVAVTGIVAGSVLLNNAELIETVKQDMGIIEQDQSSETGEGFVDTEGTDLPEIIIDENKFKDMPEITEELTQEEVEQIVEVETKQELPQEINLKVPFYSQAPDNIWALPWKEACEEASIIQAYYFVQGKKLDKATFKKEVLDIVETQKQLLGKYIDTSISETAQFLEQHYNYTDYEIIDNPSVDDIKYHLAQGHPIIAPFAGKELGNSFFANGGPRYHVLVITGYNEEFFFTNDVGTIQGENFAYSYDTIMNSMHDLVPSGEGDITHGEKRVLILK